MRRLWLAAALALMAAGAAAAAGKVVVADWSQGLAGWEEESFAGHTGYSLVSQDGRRAVKAEAKATASGLFKEMEVSLQETPILRWSWKVEGVLAKGDATKKAGDDYPARVYVVWPATFFWNTKGINYIWANRLPVGEAVPNPFTDNVWMVAVRSGPGEAGQWLSEERNVLEDYRRLFGEEPPPVGAVAIMTDADNTEGAATAWYGDISFHAR
jgi:hypothetical protein